MKHVRFAAVAIAILFAGAACSSGTTGGSTSAGNPSITIDISGASALVLTSDTSTATSSNLKKLVDNQLVDVLSAGSSQSGLKINSDNSAGLSAALTAEDVLPNVWHMEIGPAGEVVLGLSLDNPPVDVDGTSCYLIRVTGADTATSSVQCVAAAGDFVQLPWTAHVWLGDDWGDVPPMRDFVQFDSQGNIYYLGNNAGITKWSSSDGSLTQHGQEGDVMLTFQVLSDDVIFYSAFVPGSLAASGTSGVFRYITPTGIITTGLHGTDFFADASQSVLYASSNNPYGLFQAPYDTTSVGTTSELISPEQPLEIDDSHQIIGDEFGYFERMENGTILAQTIGAWCMDTDCSAFSGAAGYIVSIAPDAPAFIDTPLSEITFFRTIDNDLYIAGKNSDGQNAFIRMTIGAPDDAVSFFSGKDIQLFNFVRVDSVLYFDARDMSDGHYFFGKLDLSSGAPYTYQELSTLQAELLGLKPLL